MKKFLTLIGFLFVIGGVQAWVEPTLAPPNGNVTAPLRLNASGNLGIGSTNPVGVIDLGTGTNGRSIVWGGAAGANNYASIGTSYSSASLNLLGGLILSPTSDAYEYSYSGTYGVSGMRLESFGNGGVSFFAEPSAVRTTGTSFNRSTYERMRITSSGNVGIGTSAPNEPLEVANAANGGRFITSDGGGASRRAFLIVSPTAANPASRIESYNYGASTGLPLYINSSGGGNVSVGNIATTYRLNVAGDVNLATGSCYRVNGTCISSGTLGGTGTTNYLSKWTAASTLGNSVVYDNGTNVGIGTTNPTHKLDIVGDVYIDNNLDSTFSAYVRNTHTNGNGLSGEGGLYGIRGTATNVTGAGVYGQGASGASARGVVGAANDGRGVEGISTFGYGVYCNAAGTGFCGGTRAWTNTSDLRLKQNISTITSGLEKVLKLRGVTYSWKSDNTNKKNIGFIAQEVRDVVPEVISQNSDGYYAINESSMTAVLVEAIKDLKKENDDLRARLEKLEAKVK